MKISAAAQKIADENNFVIKTYGFEAIKEDLRKPRVVRIGAVQTSIVAPTNAPVSVQRDKIFQKIGKIIEAAAADNVNILCLQELWSELITLMINDFINKICIFHQIFYFLRLKFSFFQLCRMFFALVK